MTTTETYREKQRSTWRASADGWGKWADWNQHAMREVTDWLCQAAQLAPSMHVLDVATGLGQPALDEAKRVSPNGTVVATDLSPEMLAVAERRAREGGLRNLDFQTMDAEALGFPDRSFDAVTCAYGLMFCPDPVRAVAEMRRVLRPGGRLALAVWDEAARNPFFSTIRRAVGPILKNPPPDPKAPGQFRLAPPGELEAVLEAAGFRDFVVESVASRFECGSPEQYWEIVNDHATGLRLALEGLPQPDRDQARSAAIEAARTFVSGQGLRFAATSRCVWAAR
ncbi:MAG TPA: methyltransferase domain-containing protein [Candidatus Eisenbacteria bacterium]|jgi:SAM-dependent methyltransferase